MGIAVRDGDLLDQLPKDWAEETLNAALERGIQGSTDGLLQLHSRALEGNPAVCPAEVPSQ